MAVVTTYSKQAFNTSSTAITNVSYFRYPYIYTFEPLSTVSSNTTIVIKRHDIVNLIVESYGTIDLSSLNLYYYRYFQIYNYNTDYCYIFALNSSGYGSLVRINIDNLTVDKIPSFSLGGKIYYHNLSCSFIKKDNTVISTMYWEETNYSKYKVISFTEDSSSYQTIANKDSQHLSTNVYEEAFSNIPTILDNSNSYLYYGYRSSLGSFTKFTKVGYKQLSSNDITDTYNSLQYYKGLIISFNNKYYVFGGYLGTEKNSQIIEINPIDLSSVPVYDSNIKYDKQVAYPYENNVYCITYDNATSTEYLVSISLINYNLTYNLASSNGETIFESVTEQSPITSLHFTNVAGETQVGYVFNTLSGVTSGVFDVEQVPNKTLIGFSTVPNATTVQFPLNTSITVNIANDTTFYAVYGTYRPIATPFNINLYQKTCENNRVDKTNYITQVGTLSGVLREESSITDVTITFTSDTIPTFNYVYIEAFNRYYYVNDITSLKKDLWQMTLSVDVLMSYKEAILACTGFVDRNENEFNADLIDKKRVVEEGNTIEVSTVTNELFTATQGTYLLNGILVSTYNKNV